MEMPSNGVIGLTTIRRKVVSPISAFRQEGLRVKGNHGFSFSDGLRPAQTQTARSGQRCDAVPHSKIELYGSLKTPLARVSRSRCPRHRKRESEHPSTRQ